MARRALKVFTCKDHDAHYVGGASVVVAHDEAEALALLSAELREHGLVPERHAMTLVPVDLRKPAAIVLHNGDY